MLACGGMAGFNIHININKTTVLSIHCFLNAKMTSLKRGLMQVFTLRTYLSWNDGVFKSFVLLLICVSFLLGQRLGYFKILWSKPTHKNINIYSTNKLDASTYVVCD